MCIWTDVYPVSNFTVACNTLLYGCFFSNIAIGNLTMRTNLGSSLNHRVTFNYTARVDHSILFYFNLRMDICMIRIDYTYTISHMTFIYSPFQNPFSVG